MREQPPEFADRIKVFVLNPPREELYERINARAESHFGNGLVDEVRTLLGEGVPANSNALGAHGYRRVVEYLRGERDLQSAIEQTKRDVRHYAKRQLTWFDASRASSGWTASAIIRKRKVTCYHCLRSPQTELRKKLVTSNLVLYSHPSCRFDQLGHVGG